MSGDCKLKMHISKKKKKKIIKWNGTRGTCKLITGEKKVPQLALGQIKQGQNKHRPWQSSATLAPGHPISSLFPRAAALSLCFESFRAHLWLCNLLWGIFFPPPFIPNVDAPNGALQQPGVALAPWCLSCSAMGGWSCLEQWHEFPEGIVPPWGHPRGGFDPLSKADLVS